jgi:heat-inducible transcriptional repressor
MEDRTEDRRNAILRALVEEHIKTGEPVSSRAVLEATGLRVSGATIRNELASIEREGYAVQPHTSAGRVPTAKAYRYYVDHLSPSKPRSVLQTRVAEFYSTMHLELGRLLKATTELLTDLTQYPAVAIGPGPHGELIRAIHLVQMGAVTALVVVVTDSGRVSQELLRLDVPVTPMELDRAEQYLTKMLIGKELGESNTEISTDLAPAERAVVDDALVALGRAAQQTAEIYVGGTRQMATVWNNLATVHRVLEVLEREAKLLEILAHHSGTTIQIADELGMPADLDLAVVSSSFESGPAEGRVGVIGPMRMDYRSVISAVEAVSRELGGRVGQ